MMIQDDSWCGRMWVGVFSSICCAVSEGFRIASGVLRVIVIGNANSGVRSGRKIWSNQISHLSSYGSHHPMKLTDNHEAIHSAGKSFAKFTKFVQVSYRMHQGQSRQRKKSNFSNIENGLFRSPRNWWSEKETLASYKKKFYELVSVENSRQAGKENFSFHLIH